MSNLESANLDFTSEYLNTTAASGLSAILDTIYAVVVIHFLSQKEVGLFFFSYVFIYLFIQITRGFGKGIRKRITEKNTGRSIYLWGGICLLIPSILFIFTTFYLSVPFINTYSDFTLSLPVVVSIFLASLGYSLLFLARYYVSGCNKPAFAELIKSTVGKLSLIIITAGLLYLNSSVEYALVAVSIAYGFTGLLLFYFVPVRPVTTTKKSISEIIKFSKWSVPTSILNDFYQRLDTILLGFMVTSVAVTYYESSIKIAFLGVAISRAAAKTANVKLSGMYEDEQEIYELSMKILSISTLLAIPLLILATVEGEFILSHIYSPKYTDAYFYLLGLVIIQIFQCYRKQFEAIFNSIKRPRNTTRITTITILINIITAIPLIYYFGGLGVIYSTIISEIVRISLYYKSLNLVFDKSIFIKSIYLQYIIAMFIILLLNSIEFIVDFPSTVRFSISAVLTFTLFYYLLYKTSNRMKNILNNIKLFLQNKFSL